MDEEEQKRRRRNRREKNKKDWLIREVIQWMDGSTEDAWTNIESNGDKD